MHNGTQVIVKTKILPSKFTTFCFSFIQCHPMIIQSCSNNHFIGFRHSYSKANQEDNTPQKKGTKEQPNPNYNRQKYMRKSNIYF